MSDEPKRPYYDVAKAAAMRRAALLAELKRTFHFGTCKVVPNTLPEQEQGKKKS